MSNQYYFGISIGPIVSTLSMVRTPRALWNASYLFSFLMKHIYEAIETLPSDSNNCYQIISPAKVENGGEGKVNVGLYPDRIYVKINNALCNNENIDTCIFDKIRQTALSSLLTNLYEETENWKNVFDGNYFNIMGAWCEAEKDSLAIDKLNQRLDIMELMNVADINDMAETVYGLISKERMSPLYKIHNNAAYGVFEIKDLESIAKTTLTTNSKEKSYHRYYCVVQADGDNMGRLVSHEELKDGDNMNISKALLEFGKKAAEMIAEFGGVPIYAGGDDLLFLAPVIGWKKNTDGYRTTEHIISFIERLEEIAFKPIIDSVKRIQEDLPEGVELPNPSLSFGISVNYVKYPLYEALEEARHLLFNVAKKDTDKKAIAATLKKHSGESFKITFSRKKTEPFNSFNGVIEASTEESVVSAYAYKLRTFSHLTDMIASVDCAKNESERKRLDAMFEHLFEAKVTPTYASAIKALIAATYPYKCDELYKKCQNNISDKTLECEKRYINLIYSYMRIAKFLNGEDVKEKKRKEKSIEKEEGEKRN